MDRSIRRLAKMMAVLGGAVLLALTLITCLSIIGRALVTIAYTPVVQDKLVWLSSYLIAAHVGPVPGDFELVESGIAFCVFAFLPWCQINNGHASVDIVTRAFSVKINRFIDLVGEVLMSIVLGLMAWRLWVGTADKMRYDETTFILQYPIWWSYAISAFAAVVAALVSVYMVQVRWRAMRSDGTLTHFDRGAMH